MSGQLEPEHTFFLLKWSTEIITGLVALLTGVLLKMKGDRTQVIPITEKQLKNELMICKLKVKEELKAEFYEAIHDAMAEHKDEILVRIDEKLQAIEDKIK